MTRKKKDPNSTNLHRETQLRVETNIQGVIHDNPIEVNNIFYKMNAQDDYSPKVDMKAIGLAGNEASRERMAKKKQAPPVKQGSLSGKKPHDPAIEQAIKQDLSNRGIN